MLSLKCQQHVFVVDNTGNTENVKEKKGGELLSHNPESLTIVEIFIYPRLVFIPYLYFISSFFKLNPSFSLTHPQR